MKCLVNPKIHLEQSVTFPPKEGAKRTYVGLCTDNKVPICN